MNHLSKAILLPLLAVVISCTSETLNYNIGTPTVSECKADVTDTTKYVTLSASITNPHQVSEAGFYVSEDASMSSAEKIVASTVSERISAEYFPQGYGKTYYYKAYISNGYAEICSEKGSFRTEKFSYYVNLESTIESMTETTATVSASMTTAKGISITSKGFCYGDKENVTIEDNVKEITSSAFTSEIPCEKQIYVRAFVKDGENVAYSDPVVAVQVESISLDRETLDIYTGQSITLKATVLPTTATVSTPSWKSSNTKVATVNNGKVTAVGNGTATITATCNGKSATCTVTVTTKSTGIQLNKTTLSLNVGASETLTATVLPATTTDKTVTWSSSNEKVATVTDGKVTAIGNGTATITAKNGTNSATCKVDVIIPVTSVSLNKSELSLNAGESETLTATVLPETATNKSVTWSSSNISVATVSSNGVVSAKFKYNFPNV